MSYIQLIAVLVDGSILSRKECGAGAHSSEKQSSDLVALCKSHLDPPMSQKGWHLASQHRTFPSKASWLSAMALNKPHGFRTAHPRQPRELRHAVSRVVKAWHLVWHVSAAVNYTVPLSSREPQMIPIDRIPLQQSPSEGV